MTRVDLYTDDVILATGLETVLDATEGFHLECFISDLPKLLTSLAARVPDVLLLDLPSGAAFRDLTEIRRAAPGCKVVLWVNSISTELAFQAMSLGVRGILHRNLTAKLQISCLRKVQGGEVWFERGLTDSFFQAKRVTLSPREGQLVTLLSHGLKNREIAAALHISEGSVKVYLTRLFHKVNVKDRLELALYGMKNLPHGQMETDDDPSHQSVVPSLRNMLVEEAPEAKAMRALP